MKKIIILSALTIGFAGPAFAGKAERIEARKSHISAHIDKKIAQLNSHKSCVMSASDKGAMEACRHSHKSAMKALKAERKSMRSAMKAKFKSKKKDKI